MPYALTNHQQSDGPAYSAATSPATVSSHFKLDFKERATTNEIKRELEQKQVGEAAARVASHRVSCYSQR